jgi:hypothetical protein
MIDALFRISTLLILSTLIFASGCASEQVRGGYVEQHSGSRPLKPTGLVLVIFVDQAVMSPSGLSALRVGAPQPSVGFDDLTRAFQRISAHMSEETSDDKVKLRFQSERAKPLTSVPSYIVFISPRSLTKSPTNWMATVDIVIREEATNQTAWKGSVTVTSDPRNAKIVASGIVRSMREVGLIASAL